MTKFFPLPPDFPTLFCRSKWFYNLQSALEEKTNFGPHQLQLSRCIGPFCFHVLLGGGAGQLPLPAGQS